ncbi:MAG: response regulator transcription factor [Rudaea sp.]
MAAKIVIADDHPLFRIALRTAVANAVPGAQISETVDLAATLAELEELVEVDLVLLDLHMRDSSGLAGLAAVRTQFPSVAVLVVSGHEDPAIVRRALDHGAAGYVPKSAPADDIIAAVRTVLSNQQWVPAQVAADLARVPSDPADANLASRLSRLTGQQFRVLGLLAEGRLNKQIADVLDIQERTVKAHVSAILDKLGVRNRTQASVLLRRLELTHPPS